MDLIRHPATPSVAARFVSATIEPKPRGLYLFFVVEGDVSGLVVPAPAKPYRTDELWRGTCFELFIHDGGQSYREFNLSPSSQWAAYRFSGHRSGMEALGLDEPPRIWFSCEPGAIMLSSLVAVDLDPASRIGLSAVIEEKGGGKSYWALAHPPGEPDFHHPTCFAVQLPPAPAR